MIRSRSVRNYCIENQKPYLIECMTFRMRGHEEASGTKYVPKELFEEWADKDPLKNYERWLIAEGIISELNIDRAEKRKTKEHIEAELKLGYAAKPMLVDMDEELKDVYELRVTGYEVASTVGSGNKQYLGTISDKTGPAGNPSTRNRELRFVDGRH